MINLNKINGEYVDKIWDEEPKKSPLKEVLEQAEMGTKEAEALRKKSLEFLEKIGEEIKKGEVPNIMIVGAKIEGDGMKCVASVIGENELIVQALCESMSGKETRAVGEIVLEALERLTETNSIGNSEEKSLGLSFNLKGGK